MLLSSPPNKYDRYVFVSLSICYWFILFYFRYSDFSRLARRLTGTSVGLVLGGGGARGISHCGMIQAFYEAGTFAIIITWQSHDSHMILGVPIDMVGGTSIGALVGGLYCEDCNIETIRTRCRTFSMKMSGYFDKVLDLTWPTTSMFTGTCTCVYMYNYNYCLLFLKEDLSMD